MNRGMGRIGGSGTLRPAICMYDLSRFRASVAIDVMRTHPMVIIDGVLQENPFFVPPDQFLLELRERGIGLK